MKDLYQAIFKRKSIRKFDRELFFTQQEIFEIREEIGKAIPLIREIKVEFEILKQTKSPEKHGEYSLLFYSESSPGYLLNAGYMLQQIDLMFATLDIGACWYGLGKPKERQKNGLNFVIMLNFGKSRSSDFRENILDVKRKSPQIIWKEPFDPSVAEAVRLAPSACNTQPWRIKEQDNTINVYQNTAIKSLIPSSLLSYYNAIDMGICLCFLEVSLEHQGYEFFRELKEEGNTHSGLVPIASYIRNIGPLIEINDRI